MIESLEAQGLQLAKEKQEYLGEAYGCISITRETRLHFIHTPPKMPRFTLVWLQNAENNVFTVTYSIVS